MCAPKEFLQLAKKGIKMQKRLHAIRNNTWIITLFILSDIKLEVCYPTTISVLTVFWIIKIYRIYEILYVKSRNYDGYLATLYLNYIWLPNCLDMQPNHYKIGNVFYGHQPFKMRTFWWQATYASKENKYWFGNIESN